MGGVLSPQAGVGFLGSVTEGAQAMFEKRSETCPECEVEFRGEIRDGAEVSCPACRRQYRVLIDESTGVMSFVLKPRHHSVEPLYLPRGSIRALVSLSLSGVFWMLAVMGRAIPPSLPAVLLTVLGYYIGFRRREASSGSGATVYDASRKTYQPVYLPTGAIRLILIAGFAVSAVVLWLSDGMVQAGLREFYLIVASLLVGHLFGRYAAAHLDSEPVIVLGHVKGLAVLLATVALCAMYLFGAAGGEAGRSAAPILTAIIGFYFGSR